jgi:tetratricopeptide (TPR) repeat protein
MRRLAAALALVAPLVLAGVAPGCEFASRNRVQSINRMNEGIQLEKKGNTTSAEKLLKEAIEVDPTHAKAHWTLGQVYRKQGKLVDAENAFRGAIDNSKDKPNADYQYQLGIVIASQADAEGVTQAERETKYTGAIQAFQEATKLDPNHYKSFYRMGVLYERLDQPVPADQAFRKAIEIRPTYSPAFVSLGNMYIDYGHANVGQAVLETGTKVNDKDAKMWNGLGRAQLALNKPQDAIESFKKAKAIDPDMVDVLFGLGMAYAELRQREQAVENLQGFLQRAGGDVPEDRKRAANSTIARMQDVI